MLGLLKRLLPSTIKLWPYHASAAILDALDSILGRKDMIPPRRMIFVGRGDYRKIGSEFLQHFVQLGGLKPSDRVLDVGCGIGRMAVPLTTYLKDGRYEGFDIVPMGIEWCRKNITPRFPHFRFQLADVYNKSYNPGGSCKASVYRFPFGEGSFDFVFLTSIFTHMLPDDLEHYLHEIHRVLKNGGRCLITYFLLNDESRQLIARGKSTIDLKHDMGVWMAVHEDKPEDAIAFEEKWVRELYGRAGFSILEPIHFGSWCKRSTGVSYQDIVVAEKGDLEFIRKSG
jgi:SAM-dependent methyltransferase